MELKPCPFCSGRAKVRFAVTEDGDETISVICETCRTGIFRARIEEDDWVGYKSVNEAVEARNRRAKDD